MNNHVRAAYRLSLEPSQHIRLIAMLRDVQSLAATEAQRLDRVAGPSPTAPYAVAMLLESATLCADVISQLASQESSI